MNRFQLGDVEDANERDVLATKLRRLTKKVERLNTWNGIKYGPNYTIKIICFEQRRRITRTKKLTTILYGLSTCGEVPQIGPMPFEDMNKYLNEELGVNKT
jgi:hypothetical protein